MSKPKKILGKNVYLITPPMPKQSLELPEEVKQEMYKKFMNSLDSLEVYGVGHECTWGLKPGDMVMINPTSAKSLIFIEIDGKNLAAIFEYNILHIV
jgi:hypothetical protein